MTEFDKKLEKILENAHRKGRIAQEGYGPALEEAALAIKQAVNTLVLPPEREIVRVKQKGYGTGWTLPENSATHYSMGYNRAVQQTSENLWGKK